MHLADGTISNQICTLTAAGSAVAVAVAVSRVRPYLNRSHLSRAAVGAAVVFVAQLFDVPLFGGVGVHLVGATLLAVLAGPPLALLAMTLILTAQALFLHDGGVTALGANVFSMGVVAVAASAWLLRLTRASVFGVALASAGSMLAAVVAMSVELALSGTSPLATFALALGAHAPFAAWEALLTTAIAFAAHQAGIVALAPLRVRAG